MFRSPCKIPAMKGIKASSNNVRINPSRSTEVACQLQRINQPLVKALEAPPVSSKPTAPVIIQPLVSKPIFVLVLNFFCSSQSDGSLMLSAAKPTRTPQPQVPYSESCLSRN